MSNNGGTQWGYLNFSNTGFVFDPDNYNIIYVGTKNDGGVYKIENIWSQTLNITNLTPGGMGDVNDIAVDNNTHLYAAASDGLWHYNGSSWEKMSGLPDDNITAVVFDNMYEHLYVGTENYGVYYSSSKGKSWTEFNNGLDKLSITTLEVGYSNANYLYAGTKNAGVWSVDLVIGIEDIETVPSEYYLSQNYPNPFNPSTIIKYAIPPSPLQGEGLREARLPARQGYAVSLKVYNLLGQEITTLVDEYQRPGNYEVVWNTESSSFELTSGVYFYQLRSRDYIDTKKMILLR
jgi:hypothetical protein